MLTLLSIFFGVTVQASPALPAPQVPLSQWIAIQGDRILIDTEDNTAYLIHQNGSYTSVPVATGQRRNVWYLGRGYYGATPEGKWIIRSQHVFSDHRTFGESGRFLRMYRNGEEYTAYGIHSHANITRMLSDSSRHDSMGCILTTEGVMDILLRTFTLNDGSIEVVTVKGIDTDLL